MWITFTLRESNQKHTYTVTKFFPFYTHKCFSNLRALCELLVVNVSLLSAQSYLDLEVIADVATVEFRADQFEFPVKESLCVPVLVTDKMQDLLVVGHGVHTWNIQRGTCVKI